MINKISRGKQMTNEFLHFEKISRQTWQSLHRKTTPPLTEEELESIKSFNDQISLQDVTDVYLPLAHLIHIYKRIQRMIWPFPKEFSFNVKANPSLLSLGFWKCCRWKIHNQSPTSNPTVPYTYRC